MLLYWVIFIILLLFSWIEINDHKNKRILHGILVVIIIFFSILGAIRWETGTDWLSYLNAFKRITTWNSMFLPENIEFETGFLLLNLLTRNISTEYTFCLAVQSIIIFVFIYKGLKEESLLPIFSLWIYFTMSLAGIFFVRQTIALSILLYATKYIHLKEKKKFITWVIVAGLFHRTAFVYLLAYYCYDWKFSWSKMTLYMIASLFVGLFMSRLILMALTMFNFGIVTAKITAYLLLAGDDNSTIYSTTGTIIRAAFNRGLIFVLYWAFLKNQRKQNKVVNGLININFVGVCLYFLFAPVALSLARITAYFDLVQILIFPYFFVKQQYTQRAIIFSIITMYSIFRLFVALSAHPDAYIPYKSIFA